MSIVELWCAAIDEGVDAMPQVLHLPEEGSAGEYGVQQALTCTLLLTEPK